MKIYCPRCEDVGELQGIRCQSCCAHDWDFDHGKICIECGQDESDSLIDEAEYLYGEER